MSEETLHPFATKLYTASEIARAAGLARQSLSKCLEPVAPAGQVEIDGKQVNGWRFEDLPLNLKLKITQRGIRRGHESGESYLASIPATPWSPPLPWDRIPKRQQDKAVNLHKALARPLELRADPAVDAG
jgi:hypothetical protein